MEVWTGAGAGAGTGAGAERTALADATVGATRIRRVVTMRRTSTRRSWADADAVRFAGPRAGSRPCAIASPSQPAAIANAAAAEA